MIVPGAYSGVPTRQTMSGDENRRIDAGAQEKEEVNWAGSIETPPSWGQDALRGWARGLRCWEIGTWGNGAIGCRLIADS